MIIKRNFMALIIIGVMGILVTVMGACSNSVGSSDGQQCSLSSVEGTYGFALVGNVVDVGPISTSGTTTFNGTGNDTGAFAVTTFDTFQRFTFVGTYTVNQDCTGTATLTITPAVFGFSVLHFDAVGVDGGREIKWLITDPGIVLAGTLSKQ